MLIKKSSFILFSFSLFSLLLFSSCKENSTEPSQNILFKLTSISDSISSTKYTYKNEKIFSCENIIYGTRYQDVYYTYNDDRISTERIITSDYDSFNTFTYDGYKRLDKILLNNRRPEDTSYHYTGYMKYYYDNLNRVKKIEQYSGNDFFRSEEYVYNADDNIIRMYRRMYNDICVHTFEYDKKNNPFKDIFRYNIWGLIASKNNVVKKSIECNGLAIITNYKYQYVNNYPVKIYSEEVHGNKTYINNIILKYSRKDY